MRSCATTRLTRRCLSTQYRRLSRRNKGVGKPEYKIHSFLYSVWLPPLGLLLYGLVTYYGVHWIFADAGIVLFCLGISMAIVAIQSYIVDCYALLAGSALTSTIVFRSIVGTGATIVSGLEASLYTLRPSDRSFLFSRLPKTSCSKVACYGATSQ